MSRSIKKGAYVEDSLRRRFDKTVASGQRQPIKTPGHARSTIIPNFVGYTFAIHDGRKHDSEFVYHRKHGWYEIRRFCRDPYI